MRHHWRASGSPINCVRNIVAHLDTLLTDEEKHLLNWHEEQDADLVVMRLIWAWQQEQARYQHEKARYALLHEAFEAANANLRRQVADAGA